MNVLITGAAGLVGSQMIETLLYKGANIFAVDNLTLGTEKHIEEFIKKINFEKWDVSQRSWHFPLRGKKFDLLIHLAANSDISLGHSNPEMDCERTFSTTFETLMAARDLKIPNFIFSSSSAVYGDTKIFPTPEKSKEMYPVSIYGSGKLASENFISSFVNNYQINAWVFRFGNVVGKKLTHGVIYDFIRKLQKNPNVLEVLGNGLQHKTYIEVRDTVNGILHCFENSKAGSTHEEKFQIFNLSTNGATTVKEIAEETVRVVTNGKTKIHYGESSIGWVGDVPRTSLDVTKIMACGFRPQYESTQAVFQSIKSHYEWIHS